MAEFTNEQLLIIHTAFWRGVDTERDGQDLVKAYWLMFDELENKEEAK
jgi:hypothetical protein